MKKIVFFAFKGDPLCFNHVLLNALDTKAKGHDAHIVMEGEAVKLVMGLEQSKHPAWLKAKELGVIDSICRACSAKMGVLDQNLTAGIPLVGDMAGHPPMAPYIENGFLVITL